MDNHPEITVGSTIKPAAPDWVQICYLDDLAPNIGRCFRMLGRDIAVFRLRDGGVRALDNRCPHLGGPLADGIVGPNHVICPLHAEKYDLKTGKGPSPHKCVETFSTKINRDEIWIDATPLRKTAANPARSAHSPSRSELAA